MKLMIKFIIKRIMILLSSFYKGNNYGSIYYHDVVLGEGESFNKINVDKFRDHMRYLSDNKYKTLTFSDLDVGVTTDCKTVLITFDDGYLSNYDLVFPIMKHYGLKFNIYLEVGAIEVKDNYMTWNMVKEMSDSGLVGFGAHTFNHIDSRFINDVNYEQEIELSNKLITNVIGKEVYDFCFPFGAYDENTLRYFESKQVYKRLYTSDGSKNAFNNGLWLLGRVGIDDADTVKVLEQKLKCKYNLYYKFMRTMKYIVNGAEPKFSR